jgi:autoaggregation protein RapA/B/C
VTRPIALDDFSKISVDDANHRITGDLVANDFDAAGNPIYLRFVNGVRVGDKGVDAIQGTYGTFTFQKDGTYVYTLDATNPAVQALQHGQTLTESLNYKISDGLGATDYGLFKVMIAGPNQRPVAVDDHFDLNLANGNTVTSNVLVNDTDADGDKLQTSFIGTDSPLTYLPNNGGEVAFQGEYGTITVGRDGNFVYNVDESNTQVANLAGSQQLTEHFTYKIWDGEPIHSADQADIYINITHPEA